MNDIHGVNNKRKWNNFAVVLNVFVLAVFALVWNKNIQNLLPVAGLLRDLTIGVSHDHYRKYIFIQNCVLKYQSFYQGCPVTSAVFVLAHIWNKLKRNPG